MNLKIKVRCFYKQLLFVTILKKSKWKLLLLVELNVTHKIDNSLLEYYLHFVYSYVISRYFT